MDTVYAGFPAVFSIFIIKTTVIAINFNISTI